MILNIENVKDNKYIEYGELNNDPCSNTLNTLINNAIATYKYHNLTPYIRISKDNETYNIGKLNLYSPGDNEITIIDIPRLGKYNIITNIFIETSHEMTIFHSIKDKLPL